MSRRISVGVKHEHNRSLNRELEVLTYKRVGMIYSKEGLKNAIVRFRTSGETEKMQRCIKIHNGLVSSIRINKAQSRGLKKARR